MLILTGFLTGIISGLGIGGGTILIPVLTILMSIEQKTAQAINLIYFIPTATVAVYTHAKKGNIDKKIVKPLVVWGLVGAVLGTTAMYFVSKNLLGKGFGAFLLVLGVMEIVKGIKNK